MPLRNIFKRKPKKAKRLYSGSTECIKLDTRSFEMLVYVGETDSFAYEQTDTDSFPPLVETHHAPLLETRLALSYQDQDLMPPAAVMLYVCLRCSESDVSNYKLFVAPQVLRDDRVDAPPKEENDPIKAEFLEAHSDHEKFAEGYFEIYSNESGEMGLDPFMLDFNPSQKTPKVTNPDQDEDDYHDLYYIRLLLVVGDDERAASLEFKDTQIMDLTDDSPDGFPAYLKLWVSSDEESSKSRELRMETERDLILVETLPEREVEDNSSERDVLEQLGQMKDEDFEKVES